MSFNAGAVTGSVELDTNPAARALSGLRSHLGTFKSASDRAFAGATPPASLTSGIGRLAGGFGGAITGVVGWAGAAAAALGVTAALGTAIHAISNSLEEIEGVGKAASSLGLTTEAYTRLSHAAHMADMSQEGLTTSLQMLENNLVDAANNAGPAKDTIEQLGLSINDLINLPTDQKLGMIADGLNTVKNAGERLNLARNLFGRNSGQDLLSLLAGGSAGLKEMANQSDALGSTLNGVDVAKVQMANDAIKEVGVVLNGVVRVAAIEAAPYIRALSKELSAAGNAGETMKQQLAGAASVVMGFVNPLVSGVEAIAIGFRLARLAMNDYLLDYAKKAAAAERAGIVLAALSNPGILFNRQPAPFKLFAEELQATVADLQKDLRKGLIDTPAVDRFSAFLEKAKADANSAATAIVGAGSQIESSYKGLAKPSEDIKKLTDALASLRKEADQLGMTDLQKKLAEFTSNPDAGMGQIEEAQALLEKMRASQAAAALGDLRKEAEQFGMADWVKKLDEMKRSSLFDTAELEEAKQILEAIDSLTKSKELDDKVAAFRESLKTPADKIAETTRQLDEWLAMGKISQAERDLGVANASKDTFGEKSLPKLVKYNSAESQSAAYNRMSGMSKLDVPRQQLNEQKETNRILIDMNSRQRQMLPIEIFSAPGLA